MADPRPDINKPQAAIPKLNPQTDGSTANIVERNVARLRELFPDVLAEGKVDFDAWRETPGGTEGKGRGQKTDGGLQ